jgi:hypothetical protein
MFGKYLVVAVLRTVSANFSYRVTLSKTQFMSFTLNIDNAATPRATQITRIIQKRRPLSQKIETVETNLKTLSTTLRQLERQRDQLLGRVGDLAKVLNVKILMILPKLCIGIGDTKFEQLMTLFSIDNGLYPGKMQRL